MLPREAFIKTLKERHADLVAQIDLLILTIVGNERDHRPPAVDNVRRSLKLLHDSLAAEYHPQWLSELNQALVDASTNPRNANVARTLIEYFIVSLPQIRGHNFAEFDESVRFEDIFRQHFNACRLPDLFDSLIEGIEKIINSGQVDSRRVQDELEKLLATLRHNARGSYFSAKGCFLYAATFFKHWCWEQIKAVPGIGPTFGAVQATLDEMQPEWDRLELAVKEDITARVGSVVHSPLKIEQILPPCLESRPTEQ